VIRIIDYGVGNIQAFITMFNSLGLSAERACVPKDLTDATKLILPGVGAFDHAMQKLNKSGMRDILDSMVLEQQVPVLGVCVGMQMLASSSEEGVLAGLNWIPGRVRAFDNMFEKAAQMPLPHMGWNDLQFNSNSKLFSGFDPQPRFYFLHSYYFECLEKNDIAATATYGLEFPCVVSKRHIHGVQCHPEKSHHFGAQLLKNFVEL